MVQLAVISGVANLALLVALAFLWGISGTPHPGLVLAVALTAVAAFAAIVLVLRLRRRAVTGEAAEVPEASSRRSMPLRQGQQQLDAEDMLQNLFDNFSHGIMIRDRATRLLRANRVALAQIEHPLEDVIGKTTSEMFEILGIPDVPGGVTQQELGMMERRESDDDVMTRSERDGRETHLRISRFPLVDRAGEVRGLGVLRYDVTELIAVQRELERAKCDLEQTVLERTKELQIGERRFKTLAQASADWFWECDADLRFTYVSENFPNPGEGPAAELIGVSIPEYYRMAGHDTASGASLLDAYRARETIRDVEVVRTVGGVLGVFRLNAFPLWKDGEFAGYIGATANISELHDARSSLMEAERLASLGSMVAGVAHEINTPVGICVTAASTVSMAAEALREGFETGRLKRSAFDLALTQIVEGTKLLSSNLARAAKLISSFKSIAVDQTSEEERTFNLIDYLRDIADSLGPNLKQTKATVEISGPEEEIVLRSYPGAIAQILTNLMMNSIMHGFAAREGGRIAVAVAAEREEIEIRYSDDGAGMTEEVVKRIFDPFFTTRRGQGGSGLGMHILFNLVTQVLKGSVRCESAPGAGMSVTIRFRADRSEATEQRLHEDIHQMT